jgi:hypothetical protein
LFNALPEDGQQLALRSYELWRRNPQHPSLYFHRLRDHEDRFSVRIGHHYRALAKLTEDRVWIGTHAEYDRLVGS